MIRMRAGAAALLLTAGTGLALTGVASSVSAASTPAPAPAPAPAVSPAQAFVDRAYADLLDEAPSSDPTGVAYWVSQVNGGEPHANVAGVLAQTAAYRNLVVENGYLQVLGRDADPSGLAYWTNYLAHGGNVDQMTGSLAGSLEYTSNYGTNYDAFVKAVYQTLLGHAPDAAGESYWDAQLAAGNPMWHVAASISHSPEWYQNRVTYDYVYYHVGMPDAGGLGFWANQLQHGTPEWRLVATLVGTPNYAAFATANP